MFSIMKSIWDYWNPEKRRRELQELFDKECEYLENIGVDRKANDQNDHLMNNEANIEIRETDCSKRVGTITYLGSNDGFIDDKIFFEIKVAKGLMSELNVGSRVDYLLYRNPKTEHLTVIKIVGLVDRYWDDEINTPNNQEWDINEDSPEYYTTSQRNILGIVLQSEEKHIVVETEHNKVEVNLDSLQLDFKPQKGDRVYICCKVQNNEEYVDQEGEICEILGLFPARTMSQEKCVVDKVFDTYCVLNSDCYVTFDILSPNCNLKTGDRVIADMIECDLGQYNWRCTKLEVVYRGNENNKQSERVNNDNYAVTVSPDQKCIFGTLHEKQIVEVIVTNNCEAFMIANNVEFLGPRRGQSMVRLIEPNGLLGFKLPPKEKQTLRFEVESKFYGESRESFFINFAKFRIKRSITVIVCEDETKAEALRKNKPGQIELMNDVIAHPSRNNRSRYYANKVWNQKNEVIPGVSAFTRRRFVALHLPSYDVPNHLRDGYLTSESKMVLLDNLEGMYPFLKENLNFRNYTKRFQVLIHLEEIENFVNFRQFDRERASFRQEGEFLSLSIENLSERRPSLVIGDVVHAKNPFVEKSETYQGIIHKVLGDKILLKFSASFHTSYRNEDYRLEFFFSRFGFRKRHYSVDRIVKHLGEQFLFPNEVIKRREPQMKIELIHEENPCMKLEERKLGFYNPMLNEYQQRAVFNILRAETQNMPYIIFGPPGTGKTVTIVETILQLMTRVEGSRMLVGTPSNSGADLIATRLMQSGHVFPGDFVRLVSQNLLEKELVPEHLMPYCATVDMGLDGTFRDEMTTTESGLKLRCSMKYLGTHRITIGTCTTLGNYLQMNFPVNHFTHVLIDEAGQCTEPESMIAITQVSRSRGQVVLAGDPKQLQSVVTNRFASDYGLSLSLLERMLSCPPYRKNIECFPDSCGFDPCLVTKLLYNYRALPSILNLYNKFFYDGELLPVIDETTSDEVKTLRRISPHLFASCEERSPTQAAFFCGIRSENLQDKDSPSWYNPLEAKNVFMWTVKLYRQNIKAANIGIITPYAKQVKYLRNMFITANVDIPKIGSVEEFQGQERDVILISTVRSSKTQLPNDQKYSLGFVRCEKRMNVAISRARYLMIVFGNPHLLCLDPYWRMFIQDCVDNNAYEGCDLPENLKSNVENSNSEQCSD